MAINFKDWQKNLHEETQNELTLEDFSLEELEDFMMSEDFDSLDTQEQGYVLEAVRISSDQDLKSMTNKRTQKWHPTDVQVHRNELAKAAKERRAQNAGNGGGVKGFNAGHAKGSYRGNDDLRAQNIKNRFKSVAATPKVKKVDEALVGNQHKLDVDKDGEIEKSDLKKLRSKKEEIVVNKGQNVRENESCGKKMYREFVEEIEEIVAEAKKDDYWDFKDLKDEPKPTSRKVAGRAYGGAAQKDDDDTDDESPKAAPVKRGRGRPAGSKSGARQKGNGNNYGGLTIHSLNLPSKK